MNEVHIEAPIPEGSGVRVSMLYDVHGQGPGLSIEGPRDEVRRMLQILLAAVEGVTE